MRGSGRIGDVLAWVVGLFFVATGAVKIVASLGAGLPAGPSGFAQFLAAARIPLPQLNAYGVIAAEIVAGLGLSLGSLHPATRRLRRPLAMILAVDMIVAMATVGIRSALGHPVLVHGVPCANQPWRLPVELSTFAVLAMVALDAWGPRDRPRAQA